MMENKSFKKDLNPFALPTETDARFRLMIVAVIVLSLILGNYLPLYLLPDNLTNNLLSPEVDFTGKSIDSHSDLKDSGIDMIYNSLEYIPSVIVMMVILLLTFISAFLIYRKYPGNIINKQKLIKAENDGSGKFIKLNIEIEKLSKQCGIETPLIFIAPEFTAGAQAFGIKGQNSVRIDNGLRMLLVKNYEKFRSIMLHEMGHIINRDVSKTYIAQSVWKAVLYVFAIPTFLIVISVFLIKIIRKLSEGIDSSEVKEILFQNFPIILILLLSLTAFFWIIHLLLKSVLRTREYYADWRAAGYGARDNLISFFSDNLNKEKRNSGLKKLFDWHPSVRERIDCLKDPSGLFSLKHDLSFFVGLLIPFSLFSIIILGKVAISVSGIISGAGQVISQNFLINFITVTGGIILLILICLIPFIITSYLISSSLGLQIQRNVISDTSCGNEMSFGIKKTFLTSLFITLGMAAGSFILPYFSILNLALYYDFRAIMLEKIPLMIACFVLALILNFFWVYFVKFFTVKLFGRYVRSEKPRIRYILFNLLSSLLLSIMILPFAGIYFSIYSSKVELLNELTVILLFAVPVIYAFVFAVTVAITGVLNSKSLYCSNCGNPLPRGNLIGKSCASCNETISAWLYI